MRSADPLDRLRGDDWDHTAVDPESRLLLCLVPGKRDGAACKQVVQQVHDRTGGRTDLLMTSDEHAPYETAIREVYGIEQPRPRRPGPGRPPKPVKVLPPELCYATVRKRREKGRVVEVVRTLVFGTLVLLQALAGRSTVSTTINTSFVERHNGTDRHQNSRKHRKTYGFSKEMELHRRGVVSSSDTATTSAGCVRTLRVRGGDGSWHGPDPGDGGGLDGSRLEPLGMDDLSRQTRLANPRHHPNSYRRRVGAIIPESILVGTTLQKAVD